MAGEFSTDGMLDIYLFENQQLLERLQEVVLEQKDYDEFDEDEELSDTDSSTIDGKKIYEFYDNERLKSITLPDTLRFLGTEAILECENLDKVVIGCGIEKICINAIGFCPNLKLIEIHRDKSDIEFERAGKEFQGNSPQMVVQYITKNRTVSGLEHIKEILEMLKKEDVFLLKPLLC